MFVGTEPAPLKQQPQLLSRKSPDLAYHPVKRESLAIRFQSQMTTRGTEQDAALSGEHDERVNAEHGRAAVGVYFVVVQGSRDPILAAVKGGVVAQSALALPDYDVQQIVFGFGCVRTMIAELGPLLGQFVRIGDEVAMGDDAANVIVTHVPVSWPG